MTTRLYLTAAAATYVPPTLRGTYNDTSLSANAFRMIRQKSGANALASVTETSTTNNYKAFHGKWVTDPLAGGSVTTSDSITITMARQENNASANMTVYLTMYVTTGDSDTVRVTLLDPFVGATEFATTMTAFSFTLTFDRAGSITQGDRIVLELGYNAQNTSATSFNGDVRYGGTDATDLATSGTTGVTVRSPWVEFNTAIDAVVASSVKPPAGNASGTGTANNAGPVVTAMAGNASGTGTANQPSSSVTQPAGNASGTGTSNTPGTMRAAELASGTGTANDATVATSASNTTAAAELASGTGTANQPSIAVVTNAGNADGTGTANQPSIAVVTNAGSSSGTGTAGDPGSLRAVGHASGTGTANQPSIAVVANAGSSSGTGTAGDPGTMRAAELASGTGTANQPSIAVIATTSSADGTGTANQPGASVVATAGNASGTGTANTPLGTVRYFLTATPSTQTSDAATGSWDDTTGDGKFELGRLAAGTAEEVSRSESDATADFDVLLGTWVSPPVADGGPVAIGQVLNITVARFGAPSGSNLRPRYRMYVMSPLGVNRGDLFNLVNTGLIFNETTPTGMSLNAALTAGGTINPGDRFVLELGFRHQAANATTRTGSVYAGGTSGTILTASDTDTSHPGHVQLPAYFGPIVTASAELASGTGTANDATAGNTVAASAELASGTGTANQPAPSVTQPAGSASGTGTAGDLGSLRAVGNASATGTANQPSPSVTATAGNAGGTGTANDVIAAQAGTAPAVAASGTGTANQPSISVVTNGDNASGTGTANQPSSSVMPNAENASGTGTANQPSPSVTGTTSSATGTGTANQPSPSVTPNAGSSSGTGTAGGPAPAVTPNAGSSSGTGTADQPSPAVVAAAGNASGTGTANQASSADFVRASAELASGTGTANDASILVVDGVLAGVAGGDGAAYDASILVRSHGTSGWYGLLGTLRGTDDAPDDDLACPYDGEPLHADHNGDRVCPFDGWRPAAKGASRPADGPWSVLARSAGMAAETPDVPAGWGPVG